MGRPNVASNLAALGCQVRLIGVTGRDENGERLAEIIGSTGEITLKQIKDKSRPTTTKTRYRADGQQMLRVDDEVSDDINRQLREQIESRFATSLKWCDLVILSDYAKGALPPSLVSKLIGAAKRSRKPVIVDPKSTDFQRYAGADIITPNLAELSRATQVKGDTIQDIAK